ncbi:MAG TPA: hypothetical protein VK768_01655, partial [Chthoniobacterales bacterium]|nr:hypothetical protein [Chthoniobacterales bacterium]
KPAPKTYVVLTPGPSHDEALQGGRKRILNTVFDRSNDHRSYAHPGRTLLMDVPGVETSG